MCVDSIMHSGVEFQIFLCNGQPDQWTENSIGPAKMTFNKVKHKLKMFTFIVVPLFTYIIHFS